MLLESDPQLHLPHPIYQVAQISLSIGAQSWTGNLGVSSLPSSVSHP